MSIKGSADPLANDADSPTDQENESEDAAAKDYHPTSPKFLAIMAGLYLSAFLVALDRMIVAVAIPVITNEFNSIEDIGWYGSAYMLTASCFMPVFGRIYQMFSTKWTFLVTLLIFEVGSAICGAAPNSISFIIGRAIAGLGSAGVFAGAMIIIIPLVPLHKRPTYSAIFGMIFGISSVLGPLIGGSFTDNISWRWCFYINLPIGGFTTITLLAFFNPETQSRQQKLTFKETIQRLDPLGALFLIPSIVCLVLALQWGGTTYPWSAPRIAGLLAAFAILFVGFILVEALTPKTAMAPARILLNRSIAGSMFFGFLIYGGTMAVTYYLAIWFQAVKGDSAMKAGIKTLPTILAMVIISGPVAKFTERTGYYVPSMLLSPVLVATGAGLLSTMTRFSNRSYWIGYQVIFGLGLGSGFQQANLVSQAVLPKSDLPIGMALAIFAQQLAGSVFLAVGQNLFSRNLIKRLSGVAGLNAERIVNTGATDIHNVVPPDDLDTVLDSYNYAITRVFILGAILGAAMVVGALAVEWKSIKPKKNDKKELQDVKPGEKEGNPEFSS